MKTVVKWIPYTTDDGDALYSPIIMQNQHPLVGCAEGWANRRIVDGVHDFYFCICQKCRMVYQDYIANGLPPCKGKATP